MEFYQVNQRDTFDLEYSQRYLCCPVGKHGGWEIMKSLRVGDYVLHYNSIQQAVLGVSQVTIIGAHKGNAKSVSPIPGTVCNLYQGPHLSLNSFSNAQRIRLQSKYFKHYEVHTTPLVRKNLGRPPWTIGQVYLLKLDEARTRRFLGSVLDD